MNLTQCHVIGERKGGQAREREKQRESFNHNETEVFHVSCELLDWIYVINASSKWKNNEILQFQLH